MSASGDARPNGQMSAGASRQFRNTAQQLSQDAQDLRKSLQQAGANQKDLQSVDDIAKSLKAMDNDKAVADPRQLQELSAAALDKLSKLELDLRKRVDTSNDDLTLSGSEEMPTGFKDLVQEYYRTLSKKAGSGGTTPAPQQAPVAPKKGGGGR
jgi:hypothetical protein